MKLLTELKRRKTVGLALAEAEAEAVADANEAPKWLPNSPHLPKGAN